MLNPTSLLADALGRNLAETYRRIYGDREPRFATGLDEASRLVPHPYLHPHAGPLHLRVPRRTTAQG